MLTLKSHADFPDFNSIFALSISAKEVGTCKTPAYFPIILEENNT
ncbi:hypothetical protein [Sulfurirhabdus autotrophica]|nr:hypothetical protein [Sulfurirhabdus autotrophica]